MATVHGLLSVTLEDSQGVKVPLTIPVQISDATTLATLATDAQAFFALLDKATDAAGVVAHFSLNIAPTGLKTGTTVDNTVGNQGLFGFSQANSKYSYSVAVPALAEATVVGGTMDLAEDSDLDKFLDWFTAPPGTLKAESTALNLLAAFLRGSIRTRKHRRQQSRVTYQKGTA